MADVINRTTLELLKSVNAPDYPVAAWLVIDRAISDTIELVPVHYRKIVSEVPQEMTQAEKDAVDVAREASRKSLKKQSSRDDFAATTYAQAILQVLSDELPKPLGQLNTQLNDAIDAIVDAE